MKKTFNEKDSILYRLKTTKNMVELSDIIENVTKEDIPKISSYLPILLKHRYWIIRADTLDLISAAGLSQFKNKVLNILETDSNICVKSYALMAYFNIAGKQSLPVIKKYSQYRNTYLRKCALCLLYVATRDQSILKELKKIVVRKNSVPKSHYSIYVMFDHYLNLRKCPELIDLFKSILGRFKEDCEIDHNLVKIVNYLEKKTAIKTKHRAIK